MNQTVLHLTDLHIFSPDHEFDLFSLVNFKSYLGPLVEKINERCGQVDCLIITGDFVDMGKVENFSHANTVIEYLITQLKLDRQNVGICIGNHDIRCYDEKGTKISDDRHQFAEFAKTFSESSKIIGDESFHLTKVSNSSYFLSLDATYGRKDNKPGKLPNQHRKNLVKQLKENFPDHPNNLLIVGSHYPMTAFYEDSLNDDAFFDRGLWQSSMPLFAHIKANFKQSQILWLFGDLHYPDHLIEEDGRSIAILSGRIGIQVPDYDKIRSISIDDFRGREVEYVAMMKKFYSSFSTQPRMATAIQYSPLHDTEIIRFKYITNGHEDSIDGHWEPYDGKTIKQPYNVPEIIPFTRAIDENDDADPSAFEEDDNPILQTILKKGLYKFGRFSTRDNEVSLGWVPLNDVLGDKLIFPRIVKYSKEWLLSVLTSADCIPDKTLIVGIDFWGSVIASQLSIMTGFKNHCRASASIDNEDDYVINERFCEDLNLSTESNIILITDVVSSGRTIYNVYRKLREYFDVKGLSVNKVICIAALCDRHQDRKVKLDFLTKFGTLCGDVRIPVVDKGFLPDERLVPSQNIYS